MKILNIINNLGSGGAEKLLVNVLPLMNNIEGISNHILLLTDEGNVFEKTLVDQGVEVHTIKYKNIYSLKNIYAIRKFILEGEYQIVHSHIFPSQYWVAIANFSLFYKKNTKFVTTEHSTYNRRRSSLFFKPIEKLIYSQYDLIISITEKTRDNLMMWINPSSKNERKYKIVENGINLKSISEVNSSDKKKLIGNIDNPIIISMVGSFSSAKDQPTLIRAISRLPEQVCLLLVGVGDLVQESKNLAKDLLLDDRVFFLGFREDVSAILKTSDIIVLSSHWEGLSLSSVEGLASGKPFIASNVAGLSEVVDGHGLLFEEGNDEELAQHILKLIHDKTFYNQTAESCLKRSRKYDVKFMIEKLIELYTQL